MGGSSYAVSYTHLVLHFVPGGEQQHGDMDPLGPELLQQLKTGEPGEHDVEQDDVIDARERTVEPALPVRRSVRAVAAFLHETDERLAQMTLVLDDENAHENPPFYAWGAYFKMRYAVSGRTGEADPKARRNTWRSPFTEGRRCVRSGAIIYFYYIKKD